MKNPDNNFEWPMRFSPKEEKMMIRVVMTCEIPTTHKKGENIQAVKNYIERNPNFAAGYMTSFTADLV